MPYIVNGQIVSPDRVIAHEDRLRLDPQWRRIEDPAERSKRLRVAAQSAAVDAMLLEQAAASDPRPIDSEAVERELQVQKRMGACREGQESGLRSWIEWQFRLQRLSHEMTIRAPIPTMDEIKAFYEENIENFRGSALFRAAHIVKHINDQTTEQQARVVMEQALSELENGAQFADVADRLSDCKGMGGDLGEFVAGTMVSEFEDAIRELRAGQRTGIFRTQFGFHIAELRGKVEAGPVDFEEVKEDIRRVLTAMRQHQEYQRAMAAIRSRSDIRWLPEEVGVRAYAQE